MTRLALIGCGRWGQNILKTLQSLADTQVTYVAAQSRPEIDLKRATWLSAAADVPKDKVDGIIIATPGATHASVALPFIEYGLPVFIEKPLATSRADAARVADAARKNNSAIMVGHIHRYNPALETVQSLLPNLGPIRSLSFAGTNMGPYRDDMSVLWDWGPHAVSLALAVAGEPTQITARGENILRPKTKLYDTVWLNFGWPNRLTMTAHLSWLFPKKQFQLAIIGETSSLLWDDRAPQKVTLYQNTAPHTTLAQPSQPEHPLVAQTPPLTAELTAFLDLVQNRTPTPTDLEEGLAVTEVLATAEERMTTPKSNLE